MNLIFLRHFGAVYFSVSTIICLIIGDTKINNIKRINSHAVFFLLTYVAMLSWIDIYFDLTIMNYAGTFVIRLIDFIIPFLMTLAFTTIAVHISKKNTLDVILHAAVVFANSVFLFAGVYYQSGAFKGCAVAGFVVFLIHIGFQVNSDYKKTPNMVATLINIIITYVAAHLFIIILSQYWQNILGSGVVEVILVISNITVVSVAGILVVHYSWSIHINSISTPKPGDISLAIRANPSKYPQIVDSKHSF